MDPLSLSLFIIYLLRLLLGLQRDGRALKSNRREVQEGTMRGRLELLLRVQKCEIKSSLQPWVNCLIPEKVGLCSWLLTPKGSVRRIQRAELCELLC